MEQLVEAGGLCEVRLVLDELFVEFVDDVPENLRVYALDRVKALMEEAET